MPRFEVYLQFDSLKRDALMELRGADLVKVRTQALEALALNGGMSLVVGAVELALAVGVLAAGAGGWLHVALLLGWLGVNLALSSRYIRALGGANSASVAAVMMAIAGRPLAQTRANASRLGNQRSGSCATPNDNSSAESTITKVWRR